MAKTLPEKEGIEPMPIVSQADIAAHRIRPTLRAAETLNALANGDRDAIMGYVDALSDQVSQAVDGNTARGEAMLVCQAHTLDAIFNRLCRRAMRSDTMTQFGSYMKLALRAQSQTRATWQAIAAIQNPPVTSFVGQANISNGPQQVNIGIQPVMESTTETSNAPNKLLEEIDGKWLDTRATSSTGRIDQAMATVGSLDRPEDGTG